MARGGGGGGGGKMLLFGTLAKLIMHVDVVAVLTCRTTFNTPPPYTHIQFIPFPRKLVAAIAVKIKNTQMSPPLRKVHFEEQSNHFQIQHVQCIT